MKIELNSEWKKIMEDLDIINEKAMNDIRFKKIKTAMDGNNLKDALTDINSILESLKSIIKKLTLEDIELGYNKKEGTIQYDFEPEIEYYLNNLKRIIKKDTKNSMDEDDYFLNKINNGNNLTTFVDFDIDKSSFNKVDIGGYGLPEFFKGLGLGKLLYKAIVKKLKYASLNGNAERISREASLLIASIVKDEEMYSFTIDNYILSFWNECSYEYIISILKEFYKECKNTDNIQFDYTFLEKYNLNDKKLKEIVLPSKVNENVKTDNISKSAQYKIINNVLDSYTNKGVSLEDMLEYFNRIEDNFMYILSKVEQKCTISDIEYDYDQLREALKDSIRDRVYFLNDIKKLPK